MVLCEHLGAKIVKKGDNTTVKTYKRTIKTYKTTHNVSFESLLMHFCFVKAAPRQGIGI